jgi:hypothetical protein
VLNGLHQRFGNNKKNHEKLKSREGVGRARGREKYGSRWKETHGHGPRNNIFFGRARPKDDDEDGA